MAKIVQCLHRGEKSYGFKNEGWGDCEICIPNHKNINCKGYCPVTIIKFYVEEADNCMSGDDIPAPTYRTRNYGECEIENVDI